MAQYKVTDVTANKTIVASDTESLLNSLRAGGLGPKGCHGGGCGVCKVHILEGDYVKFKKMSRAKVSAEEEQDNIVLACCVKPSSDIVFEELYEQ